MLVPVISYLIDECQMEFLSVLLWIFGSSFFFHICVLCLPSSLHPECASSSLCCSPTAVNRLKSCTPAQPHKNQRPKRSLCVVLTVTSEMTMSTLLEMSPWRCTLGTASSEIRPCWGVTSLQPDCPLHCWQTVVAISGIRQMIQMEKDKKFLPSHVLLTICP